LKINKATGNINEEISGINMDTGNILNRNADVIWISKNDMPIFVMGYCYN